MGEGTPKHSVSVAAAVVRDDGRLLAIQRRDNAHWEPPGGVLEVEETIEDGLRREVREETGIEIEVQRLTGVYKNMELAVVALVFRCRPVAGVAKPTREAKAVDWLAPDEIRERMDEAYSVRMIDALDQRAPTAVRVHDGVTLRRGSSNAGRQLASDHLNPMRQADHFRSAVRQAASDQLLLELVRVGEGKVTQSTVEVSVRLSPASKERAGELTYAAAWHHDLSGRWLPGTHADADRLVHRLRFDVLEAGPAGFSVSLQHRP